MKTRTLHNTIAKHPFKGFTLIELMVSVSIFAIVLTLTMGAVISILDANRKAQTISSVMDNLNSTLESMTRTIKTNTEYSIASGNSSITVRKKEGLDISYVSYTYAETDGRGRIEYRYGFGAAGIALTSPDVDVDTFEITKLAPTTACSQPKLLIVVAGTAGLNTKTRTQFELQTVVSQRDFTLPASCLLVP